jgi:transmembrane sensor
MEKNIPYHLIASQLDGSIDTASKAEFDAWLDQDAGNQAIYDNFRKVWLKTGELSESYSPDAYAALNKVHSKLEGVPSAKTFNIKRNYFLFFKIAAGIAIIVISGYLYFSLRSPSLMIAETRQNQKTELYTDDGSKIVLNENSKLAYPGYFKGKERKVQLEGEAFFEIAKDSLHPFIIEANGTQTIVLGTKFNLKSYHSDSINIIDLIEGKVAFTNLKTNETLILLPGDRAIIDLRSGITEKQLQESRNFESWKNGILIFENTPLAIVAKDLTEYYGCQFTLSDTTISKLRLNGNFNNKSLHYVAKAVEEALNVDFVENGKTIEIKSK